MGLREEIEAALAAAAADGVQQLSIDGDEEVWVAGAAATDGTLEVRTGDRGARRGLRRRRADRSVMEAHGFRHNFYDVWVLPVPPGAGQAARGAAAAVSALVGGLGVEPDARAEVFFTQRGAKDLVLWPSDEPLELAGFELDGDERLSGRRVEPDEAVAAARTALGALGIGAGDPLFTHLGD